MKCKKEGCQGESVPPQIYCSKKCAPYGSIVDVNSYTKSGRTGGSSTKARGEAWDRRCEGDPFEKSTTSGEKLPPPRRDTTPTSAPAERRSETGGTVNPPPFVMNATRSEWTEHEPTEKTKTEDGENGTGATMSNSEIKNAVAELTENLLEDSTVLSKTSETEKLLQMNLVDDTISDLRGLMRSLVERNQTLEWQGVQTVNAACNTAKNITNLMRLKLDVVKEIRRGGYPQVEKGNQ